MLFTHSEIFKIFKIRIILQFAVVQVAAIKFYHFAMFFDRLDDPDNIAISCSNNWEAAIHTAQKLALNLIKGGMTGIEVVNTLSVFEI